MEGWKKDKLGNLLELVYGKSLPKNKRVDGKIPVHGSNGIVGFHNVAIVNEPGIIVGRKGSAGKVHISKVPFCPIDTTFYITQQYSKLDLEYLYYALNFLDLKRILGDVGVPGLNREMAYFEELFYPPDKAEQRKIAHVLNTVQKAIEQQDKLIRTTTELKKALMQKLFTEGTRGELQKKTEIGLVPESWEVVEFPKFVLLQRGKDLTKKNFMDGDIPVAGSNGVIGYHNQSFVKAPGVTVGRSGSCGIVNYYEKDFWAHNTSLYVKDFNGNDEMFSFNYLQFLDIGKFKTGASVPTLDRNSLNTFEVPVPKKEEQKEIAKYIQTIESKIESSKNKKETLTALFKTLLHELMTGQRRVNELKLD
ncbi:MAG: restriction endonuclease subunit S [Deltaproteobacteria bacterium]|nr:restriction endonuclease subunit S [Deltaproteobacteria bacterium]